MFTPPQTFINTPPLPQFQIPRNNPAYNTDFCKDFDGENYAMINDGECTWGGPRVGSPTITIKHRA